MLAGRGIEPDLSHVEIRFVHMPAMQASFESMIGMILVSSTVPSEEAHVLEDLWLHGGAADGAAHCLAASRRPLKVGGSDFAVEEGLRFLSMETGATGAGEKTTP